MNNAQLTLVVLSFHPSCGVVPVVPQEETGYTAVFYATREGHLDILKLLLGAKVPRHGYPVGFGVGTVGACDDLWRLNHKCHLGACGQFFEKGGIDLVLQSLFKSASCIQS